MKVSVFIDELVNDLDLEFSEISPPLWRVVFCRLCHKCGCSVCSVRFPRFTETWNSIL